MNIKSYIFLQAYRIKSSYILLKDYECLYRYVSDPYMSLRFYFLYIISGRTG